MVSSRPEVVPGQFEEQILQIGRRHAQIREICADALELGERRRHIVRKKLDGAVPSLCVGGERNARRPSGLGQADQGCGKVISNQPRGLSLGNDPPVIDNGDPVAEPLSLFHIMCGEHDGLPPTPHCLDQAPEVAPGLWIESSRRLVEEHQVGIVDQSDREQQPLALAARELACISVQDLGQIAESDELFAIRGSAVEARKHGERLAHCLKVLECSRLKLDPDRLAVLPVKRAATVEDRPGGWRLDPFEHLEGRRFARTVRPQKTETLTGLDMKTDTIHGAHTRIDPHEIMGFEKAVHSRAVYALRERQDPPATDVIAHADQSSVDPSTLIKSSWIRRMSLTCCLVMLSACASPKIVESPDPSDRPVTLGLDQAQMDDGYRLPIRVWSAGDDPPIVLLGLHGFNDYANAFAPIGRDLAQVGITTYAVDQRGFGATAQPGRWHGSNRLAADLRNLVDQLRARHPNARVYVAGESMGGAVILTAMGQGALPVEGVILIAPAVWSRDTMPWYQRLALDAAVRTLPWLKLTGEGIRLSPSDHIEMLRAMGQDPLVIKATRVDALWGITDLMDRAQASAGRLQTPALLLYGEQDEIIPRNAFCRFVEKLPSEDPDLTFVLYQRGWHMLPRDRQGARVRDDIASWLQDREAPLPSGEETTPNGKRASAFCERTDP